MPKPIDEVESEREALRRTLRRSGREGRMEPAAAMPCGVVAAVSVGRTARVTQPVGYAVGVMHTP